MGRDVLCGGGQPGDPGDGTAGRPDDLSPAHAAVAADLHRRHADVRGGRGRHHADRGAGGAGFRRRADAVHVAHLRAAQSRARAPHHDEGDDLRHLRADLRVAGALRRADGAIRLARHLRGPVAGGGGGVRAGGRVLPASPPARAQGRFRLAGLAVRHRLRAGGADRAARLPAGALRAPRWLAGAGAAHPGSGRADRLDRHPPDRPSAAVGGPARHAAASFHDGHGVLRHLLRLCQCMELPVGEPAAERPGFPLRDHGAVHEPVGAGDAAAGHRQLPADPLPAAQACADRHRFRADGGRDAVAVPHGHARRIGRCWRPAS